MHLNMPTKKEIYDIEQENPGVIHLYAEGMFYRAYEMSANGVTSKTVF